MKCEKQRHQGEENSSKPKRGGPAFPAYTHLAAGGQEQERLLPGSEIPA